MERLLNLVFTRENRKIKSVLFLNEDNGFLFKKYME